MKTTINIDDKLLEEAMKSIGVKTKTEAIEKGLQELILIKKRKELAGLFGAEKTINGPRRRRNT
jgi:Arc/MetJ family transcription regulator